MATETHTTPACIFCHRSSLVELTAQEAAALRAGALIQDAAPTRPAPERELIRSGELVSITIDRARRIPRVAAEAYVARRCGLAVHTLIATAGVDAEAALPSDSSTTD